MLILHGDNTQLSRQFLTARVKSFFGEVVWLEGRDLKIEEIKQALESQTLLGNDRLVVLERFFLDKKNKQKKLIIDYLLKEKPKNLIVWEEEKIPPQALKNFSFAEIKLFELPKIIFWFLDSLEPSNKKRALQLLHQALKKQPPEFIFYLLTKRVKDLLIAKDLGEKGIENYYQHPWQRKKIATQAQKIETERLKKFYQRLLLVDYLQKSGRAVFPLDYYLDLLVLSL